MRHQLLGETAPAPRSFGEHIEDDSLFADREAELSVFKATRMREHPTELNPCTSDDLVRTIGGRCQPTYVLARGNCRSEVRDCRVKQLFVHARRKLAHVVKHPRAMLSDCRD